MRTRSGWAALVSAVLVSAAGCSGEEPVDPPTSAPTSEESETPSPTPTPPALPPEASTQDAVGAEAFVRHWFDLVNYGYMSGDPAPMVSVSDDLCVECFEYEDRITEATSNGYRLQNPALVVVSAAGGIPDGTGRAPVDVTYDQPATVVRDATGQQIDYPAQGQEAVVAFADFKEGSWSMIGLALPDS